jgi:hypothetical protein
MSLTVHQESNRVHVDQRQFIHLERNAAWGSLD